MKTISIAPWNVKDSDKIRLDDCGFLRYFPILKIVKRKCDLCPGYAWRFYYMSNNHEKFISVYGRAGRLKAEKISVARE